METIPLATQINPPLAAPRPASSEPPPPGVKLRRERSPGGRALVQPAGYRWYPGFKVAADFVLASLLTIPALPLVLLAALLVKLTSRGPAFYTQTRVGRQGRLFLILKLRTMIHNCESLTGPRWSIP